ncbi:MAG: PAS domain-containing protein [Deltaproteobacteria bacterium]|nr:PAS domain-containing protein [Deltaproteobacteria bacterium]
MVVDQAGRILHVHGRTGKYLELPAGKQDLDVSNMAREGLRSELFSAMRRASASKREIRRRGIRVKTNSEFEGIDLTVTPLNEPPPLENTFMIVFEETRGPSEAPAAKGPEQDEAAPDPRPNMALEQKLMNLQEDYKSAMESLKTSNEEMRSANEELQSSNEELESSREELQSLNEELSTVNAELQNKNEALSEAYFSITDVLNSTKIAIVFLNNDLTVKRFTPEAAGLINLIKTDIGRPISHISHNLRIDDLRQRVKSVADTLSAVEDEVQTRDGHWYRMCIMLHRNKDNRIEGTVLTFINIDAQKKGQAEIERLMEKKVAAAKRFSDSIVDTVRESLLVLDRNFRVLTANQRFYKTFQMAEKEVEGKGLFELEDRQWDIPDLRTLFNKLTTESKAFDDYQIEHQFPKIGFRKMLLNARLLVEDESESGRILLAMEDVTDRGPLEKEDQ